MENYSGKKGRSRIRIIESDSESDTEDGESLENESVPFFDDGDNDNLSMPMEGVRLLDTKGSNYIHDSDESYRNDLSNKNKRTPPRRLEDFSWSSSHESNSSPSPLLGETVKKKQISGRGSSSSDEKCNSSLSPSPLVDSSMISSCGKKGLEPKRFCQAKSSTTKTHEFLDIKAAYTTDLFLSNSSSSSLSTSSSSDDEYLFEHRKTTEKKSRKNNFSWSFHKGRQEYTIGGNDKIPPFSIPSDLYEQLYDFQKDGVAWMVGLHLPKIGGILGDDMGMGKTFTTLSLLGGLMKAKTIRKAIVVAPVSVLRNWENEARKILRLCCDVKIQVLSSEITVYNRKKRLHQALEAQSSQLVITSFGLVANNPDHFTQRVARRQVWDYVILDEAHKIKNPNTKNSKAIEMIAKSEKTRRLILTGTPIMNNLKELHALFTFATSGKVLGTQKEFQNDFGKPIEAARSADADDLQVKRGDEAMQELQKMIQPYFLQRTKAEYLAEALPPKHEYVLWTKLSPLQREMYTEYIQSEIVSSLLEGEAKSPMFAITWLQKLCGHPLLVEEKTSDSFGNFDKYDSNQLMAASTKLEVMYNVVNALIRKGHRTLIFSQFTKVLDIIEQILKGKFKLSRIDGGTKEKDRQKYVDEFNEPGSDIDIMLISTKAGGQGLTLTGADSCVVYDPSWNPSEDAQAVDRCYRLGQKKKVQVFRLIAAGTVEEKRYEKQIHKDGIRRAILTNSGNNTAKYFTKDELRKKVFTLGDEGESEFLDKLKMRGFAYDAGKNPNHSYFSHEGVVGQSSHDIVYSLPENFYFDALIQSPSHQPFSNPPPSATWLTKKGAPKVMSRPPKALSEKIEHFAGNENKENSSNVRLKGIGTSHVEVSLNTLKKTLLQVEDLRFSGKSEQAVGLLMNLLENDAGALSEADSLKVHMLVSSMTSKLGWLSD